MTATWRARLPLVLTALVLVSGLFAVPAVQDAATLHAVADVQLARPFGYLALAPLSDCLDTLTLLSIRQDLALVGGILTLWLVAQVLGSRSRSRSASRSTDWRGTLLSLVVIATSIALAYTAAIFLPRPMAYVTSLDPDALRVDFHSHTGSSRDARPGFSVDENRRWHMAGGYDVAYVTDHATFLGAERGLEHDPRTGAGGVILLSGIEANWRGEHVGLLGPETTVRHVLSRDLREVDAHDLAIATHSSGRGPLLVWNHPRDPRLAAIAFGSGGVAGVRAVEIANGAPSSIDLLRPKRRRMVELARSHDLALLSGTDNHGWGFAAPNWTLLRVAHWRDLDRRQLAADIERTVRDGGFTASRVVERTTMDAGAGAALLSLSVLTVPWRMLTTLSASERIVWLAWIWSLAWARRRRVVTAAALQTPAT